MIKFDQPATELIRKQVKNNDFGVKEAAVWALVKLGDPNTIGDISALLIRRAGCEISATCSGLFQGDISTPVVKAIDKSKEAGKIAGIELLAQRKSSANLNTVLAQTKSDNESVKKAAYAALKDVVEERDLVNMCGMLETADASTIVPLQQAVITAVSGMSKEAQVSTISNRMLQAGESKKHLYYIVLAQTGDAKALFCNLGRLC